MPLQAYFRIHFPNKPHFEPKNLPWVVKRKDMTYLCDTTYDKHDRVCINYENWAISTLKPVHIISEKT